jgi:hypothetical protein
MTTLQYARAPRGKVPCIAGCPIWPISNESDLAALRATTALFGAQLERAEPDCYRSVRRAAVRPDAATQLVAYPHPELRPLAELYARLSSRRAQRVPLDQVRRAMPEIVVCLWKDLTLDHLQRIHDACLERPIGLIVAHTPRQLRQRVIRAAAAACLEPPAEGAMVSVLGSDTTARRGQIATDHPTAAALLHLGHSDGLDLNFTKEEVLCDIRRIVAVGGAGIRQIPCVKRDHCYRLNMGLAAAMDSSRLLDPRDLRARAAVFLTCFGVPASDTLVPPSWSLLEGLLGSPLLGCVVTALGVSMPASSDLPALERALSAGSTIGEALYRNPELSRNAHERCRLLLFGDPRTRPVKATRVIPAQSLPHSARSSGGRRVRISVTASRWTPDGRIQFMLDLLRVAADSHPGVDERVATVREQHTSGLARDADLIACLEGLAPLWDHWTRTCQPPKRSAHRPSCPGCARRGRSFAYEWGASSTSRIVSVCARCGIFQDVEKDSDLVHHRPRLRGAAVVISDGAADAWVLVRHKDELKKSTRWTLPAGKNRAQLIAPPEASVLPGTGLDMLNVIYLRDLEIASWEFKLKIVNGA